MARINIVVAAVFSAFAIAVLIATTRFPISADQPLTLGTATFPRMLSFGILFLAAILALTNLKAYKKEKIEGRKTIFDPQQSKVVAVGFFIILVGAIVMIYLGFIISMIAVNLAFLLYFRVKNKIVLALVPIAITVSVYLVFVEVLNIALPPGALFS